MLLRRWPDIPEVSIAAYITLEITAEKLRCVLQRLQCRDFLDLGLLLDDADLTAATELFRRKSLHKGLDPATFAEKFEKRVQAQICAAKSVDQLERSGPRIGWLALGLAVSRRIPADRHLAPDGRGGGAVLDGEDEDLAVASGLRVAGERQGRDRRANRAMHVLGCVLTARRRMAV